MRIHFEWRGAPGPVTYKNERNLIGGYFTNRSQAARELDFASSKLVTTIVAIIIFKVIGFYVSQLLG